MNSPQMQVILTEDVHSYQLPLKHQHIRGHKLLPIVHYLLQDIRLLRHPAQQDILKQDRYLKATKTVSMYAKYAKADGLSQSIQCDGNTHLLKAVQTLPTTTWVIVLLSPAGVV